MRVLSAQFTLKNFGILLFAAIVFSPILALVIETVLSVSQGNEDWLVLAVPAGRRVILLAKSLGLAATVAICGTLLGTLAALFLWRWDTGPFSRLRWLFLVPAVLPPYIHALTWSSSLNTLNGLLEIIGLPDIPLHGWIISWWVQVMSLLPVAAGLALVGLKSVEPRLIEAARTAGNDFHGLIRIILPLAAPSLVAAGGLIFLLSLLDFSVPSLFSVNVYSLEVFAEFSATAEPAKALLLSLPLLIITIVIISISFSTIKKAAQNKGWQEATWNTKPVWPAWLNILQVVAFIILVIQFVLPLVNLTVTSVTEGEFIPAITAAGSEITFTVLVAAATAMISLPLALSVAAGIEKSGRLQSLWWFFVIIPLAIPSSLVGIGLISVWNQSFMTVIYGSWLMPVLAGIVRFTSLAVIVVTAQIRRIDPKLYEAARVFQKNNRHTIFKVRLPLLLPGLLGAAGLSFVLTLGELGATLLVAPPGQATLTMRIYNFLHYGASGTVAGLCLMMMVCLIIVGVLAAMVLLRKPDNSWFREKRL